MKRTLNIFFVDVSPGAMQWKSDLIEYNALSSDGRPSYYVQKMFSTYRGDKNGHREGREHRNAKPYTYSKDSLKDITPQAIPLIFYGDRRDFITVSKNTVDVME